MMLWADEIEFYATFPERVEFRGRTADLLFTSCIKSLLCESSGLFYPPCR